MQIETRNAVTGLLRSRKPRVAIAMLAALGFSATASAALNDPPYWNLFDTSVTYGGGDYAETGDGKVVYLCGTSDCVGSNAAGGTGYAQFSIIEEGPTGSGLINPFLRFQHNEQSGQGNSKTEAAYNTNNDALQKLTDGNPDLNFENQAKDTNAGGSPDFNHALVYSQLAIDKDGFLTFKLDINEPGDTCNKNQDCIAKNTLRLDELQFFISTTDKLSLYDPSWNTVGSTAPGSGNFGLDPLGGGTNTVKFWDMDFDKIKGGFGGLLLDNLNSSAPGQAGSGDYDVQVKVPTTQLLKDFVADNGGKELYVYLYNYAGQADIVNCPKGQKSGCGEAESGFEEWAAVLGPQEGGGGGPPTSVPVPATALLFAAGLLGMAWGRKR